MAKMVKCKTCGEEIAKSAKICPKCGAKQKRHTALGVILVVIGVLLFAAAIGGGNDKPQKVGDAATVQDQENQGSEIVEPEKTAFGVGEQVDLNDIIVTFVSVEETNGEQFMGPEDGNVFILCEFEIENNSGKDIAVSSIMSFEAYVDDYSTGMNLSATVSSDKAQLDGAVAAGKKMNGVIGYEAPKDWSEIEIRFTPDFWNRSDITFVYNK